MAKARSRYLFGLIFTFSGFVFTLIIGALLKLQPLFMHGAKSPESTARSCFKADELFPDALSLSWCHSPAALYAALAVMFYLLLLREKSGSSATLSTLVSKAVVREKTYYEITDSEEEAPLMRDMSPRGQGYGDHL